MIDLAEALYATLETPEKLDRFVTHVIKKQGHYENANEVLADLKKYAQRIKTYNIINTPRDTKRPLTR